MPSPTTHARIHSRMLTIKGPTPPFRRTPRAFPSPFFLRSYTIHEGIDVDGVQQGSLLLYLMTENGNLELKTDKV